ncbi:MAG TPA: IPT/TIG domain-containing protein [Bryobacteraceae bacterium]|nr:IPT/TIG domain-containing protein [Bryobacteraceae bacterium]
MSPRSISWKRTWLIALVLLSIGGARAQTVSSAMVGTNPAGPSFMVDGQFYNSTQTFYWPQGSKHILTLFYSFDANGNPLGYQATSDGKTEYTFSGWTLVRPSGNITLPDLTVTITADPSTVAYVASISTSYQVQLLFPQASPNATCSGAPGNAGPTGFQDGVVYLGGACYATSATFFAGAGQITLAEFPYPGWVFYGWEINGGFQAPPITSYNITGPTTIMPLFSIAKRVHFLTNPPGLKVVVDSAVSDTPLAPSADGAFCNSATSSSISGTPPPGFPILCTGDFDFLPLSSHRVGANSPQLDNYNNYWVFEGFTNGLGQDAVFVPDTQTNIATTLTATFVAGVKVALISSQPGLKFIVDGRSNWQSYTFVWGQGETHTISVPSTQVDGNGRTWNFVKWSNGGPQTQTLVLPVGVTAIPLTATFVEQPEVSINSVPQGIQLTANGSPCTTPCVISQPSGTSIQVVAPTTISSSSTSRLSFTGWADGATSATRTISFSGNAQAFQANYQSQWALTSAAVPAGTASFTYSPPTPDGFFNDGTPVTVTVVPASGSKFVKWGGDLSGAYTPAYLTMNAPHSIVAYTQPVPSIAPAGIMSAAGATPDGTMAPGSEISIYGNNLAPTPQIASTNPLPQSLGDITVTIGNYLLPLLFVSPTQINAQLPVELVDGKYTLLVQQTGQPDVSGTLTVSRNAPGMFTQSNPQNLPLVLALHQDGTLVTFDSPAIHGETISIYGTGFGPYVNTTFDGFFVPAAPANSVADPVVLKIGTVTKTADFAGAAPGAVGLTLVQMKITGDLPTGTTVNMQVQVNNKMSAAVVLPLQ